MIVLHSHNCLCLNVYHKVSPEGIVFILKICKTENQNLQVKRQIFCEASVFARKYILVTCFYINKFASLKIKNMC